GKPTKLSIYPYTTLFLSEDLALHVDDDLLRQVAACHRFRNVRDVAHLGGEVARHRVDAVGEVLPRARDAAHVRLTAQAAFRADIARNPNHLNSNHLDMLY